jgi:predicted nucleic acid-binding protein
MFLIDKKKNEAISISKKTFQELEFKERKHLQEWICKNTDILGERLLIIQKEFSGFDDTKERLDLLAIDENGNLVIIENKLDDSGRDVVWQSLKYASYCSGLTKSDIKDIFQKYIDEQGKNEYAEKVLCEFLAVEDFGEIELNSDDQRIIMIAANFRKEVTSTAMWLLDHNIKIKCIRVTPYELNDQILLDTEQIIPIVDAEEYLIKIANKKQEELISKEKNQTRHTVRIDFWTRLLQEMNEQSDLFKNISPSKDNWIGCGSGHSGLAYNFVITGNYARIELWINRGMQNENKELFDKIYNHKEKIETSFGDQLDWQRLDDGKGSRIAYWLKDVSVFNEEDWPQMINFLTSNMIKFEKSIKNVLRDVFKK